MSKKGRFMSFLGGAALGAGLGMLFSPKSGEENRKDLMNQISILWDKIRGLDANEIKQKLESKLKEIEAGLKELNKEKVLNIAKEKSEQIKSKIEELVETAKEAGKPIIEDAANSVKKELAKVTREVLRKLEVNEE